MSLDPPSQFSRRTLVQAGLGLGAVAALSACGGSPAGSQPLPTDARVGAAVSGGVLRIARPPASRAETLDPASGLSAYEYLGALYNRITRIGWDGAVIPDLAESWESSSDARRWRFTLRDGVTFHDGHVLTAEDAAFSLRRILDPAVASPQAGVFEPLIEPSSITAPDARTLQIDLLSPNAEFPSLLAAYQCYIIKAGSGDSVATAGIGTGPFRLVSFKAAGQGEVAAYPDHFAGPPTLAGIEFFSISDQQARTNALLAGQVDLLSQTNLDFVTARVVNASPKTTIARVKNGQWYTIPMLTSIDPFNTSRLRQAMKHAYDPQAMVDTAIQGTGTPGLDNPVPPSDPYWVQTELSRSPEKAEQILRDLGREDFRIDLYTSAYDAVLTPMALAYRSSVARAGIDIGVTTASADSYFTDIWMQKPMMTTYWYTGRPVDQLLNQIFRSGSSYNETAWDDKRFDQLLDSARAETNADRRRAIYQDAQQYIVDNSGSITPFFADRLVGISKDVVNYRERGFEFDYLGIGLSQP